MNNWNLKYFPLLQTDSPQLLFPLKLINDNLQFPISTEINFKGLIPQLIDTVIDYDID